MNRRRTRLAIITVALLILIASLWLPFRVRWGAAPQPAASYEEAVEQVARMQERDRAPGSPAVHSLCHTALRTHGQRAPRAIVFLHGLTACPAQFAPLADHFYALGYNVLIPRLPYHGLDDAMTPDLAQLTAEDLLQVANEAVDAAAGLGDEVIIVGFSMGGTTAAWLAQHRGEVAHVALLSPFLSADVIPRPLLRPAARLGLWLPNRFLWWNPELKETIPIQPYAYPRFPSHAVAQIVRLGASVLQESRAAAPQVHSILVITNASPIEVVDNVVTHDLVMAWQQHAQVTVESAELPAEWGLEHDYIRPLPGSQPVDVTEVVHPVLVEAIHSLAQRAP